jgi:hypothetical protein
MDTEQHLQRIKQKCQEYIDHASANVTDFYGGRAIAGWRSTIAAIEFIERTAFHAGRMADEILIAWPEETL